MKRYFVTALAALAVAGCNDSDSSHDVIDKKNSYASVMKQLESSGQMPALDETDSMLGIDDDADGVRDDIQRYISNLDQPQENKKALLKYAKAVQKTMSVDISDEQAVKNSVEKSLFQVSCVIYQFEDGQEAYAFVNQMVGFTRNTKQRYEQGQKLDDAYSGSVYRLPSEEDCQ